MVVGDADIPGDDTGWQVAEHRSHRIVAFVGQKMVTNHFVVVGEQHGNGADVRIVFQVHREVEHDVIDFRQIPTAQGVLQLENVVFFADSDVFLHHIGGDFAAGGQHHLQFLKFSEDAG